MPKTKIEDKETIEEIENIKANQKASDDFDKINNLEDNFEDFLDYQNSYEKFEKDQEDALRKKNFSKNQENEKTEIIISNYDGIEEKIILKDIPEEKEEISFLVSSDENDINDFDLTENDLLKETKISIIDEEGNEKQFILSKPSEEVLSPFQNALDKNKGSEKIEDQLLELKDYILKNKDKIKDISVKKGNYSRKIPLKDFINKELNTTNYSSNPDKLGEDIILSLLKPLKIYNNYFTQTKLEKNNSNDIQKELSKNNYSLNVNGEEYKFKKYSEDYKKIIVENKEGKYFEIDNNKNLSFILGPEKSLNNIELNLLNKGKSLITSTDIPFKLNIEDGVIKFQTITNDEYIKNIEVKSKEIIDNKITNKVKQ